jgi:TatA/E family protein of Tat protein translocase
VELGVVCVVALLLFGSKLPSAMRGIGGGVRAFRQEIQEVTK